MMRILQSREKRVTLPKESAAEEFVLDLCGAVKRHRQMPGDFNPKYVPHKRIASNLALVRNVEGMLALEGAVCPSDVRGLYRVVRWL
jgi:hypothetical protein